jgi:hypothetical protein
LGAALEASVRIGLADDFSNPLAANARTDAPFQVRPYSEVIGTNIFQQFSVKL